MELSKIIEALLFASPDPVSTPHLARMVCEACEKFEEGQEPDNVAELKQTSPEQVDAVIAALNAQYQESGRSFRVSERATGWKLFSLPDFGHWVRELFPGKKPSRLSPPALETLAIIAYRQPMTKAAVEAVRGVAIDGVLNTLIDRALVKIGGRADLPGRPLLYETTDLFLEHFGIKHIEDLPNSAELRQVKLPEPEPPKTADEEGTENDRSPRSAEEAETQLALSGVEGEASAEMTDAEALVTTYEPSEEELEAQEEATANSD
ncbi:MAG: SMC-Scp complex subunit ScpB [Salinibacterium sp.]|nr:SMC-Scp complex subunit ScpB [Salinibacterium sp.]